MTSKHVVQLAWLIAGLCMASMALAATWVVGPGSADPTMAQALARADDGDVIEVLPGRYHGDVAVITQRKLTIRGVGARPVFVAEGRHAEGKAIWVVRDGDIQIENIEFRGARVPDLNGAGIRFENGRLRLLRCAFFDNEMGLLTADVANAELHIEDSEFAQAPLHPGSLHHLLYIGRIGRATIINSRFHQGYIGHLIKSRARETVIANNVIVDGPLGRASYEIDLPNGGLARITGNTVGQSEHSENSTMVSFGAEGAAWPRSALILEDNTLISMLPQHAWFVRVWHDRLPASATVEVRRNRLVGRGGMALGPNALLESNPNMQRP